MRRLYKVLLGFIPLLLATAGFAQTTITTTGATYNGTNSCGAGGNSCFITFVVNNTNSSGIILTGLSQYSTTSENGATATLLVSTSSLSGPVTLPNAAFTSVASQTISGVTATGINPVLTNLSYLIPANTQVRFLLQVSSTNSYSGTGVGTVTPNTFTTGGVSLYTGDYTIASAFVGFGGPNNPRFFTGAITFIPALPCTSPPTAGTTTTTATQVCAASPIQIGVTGNSQGTGQTYQLLTASSSGGPYTAVGTAQGGSNFTANPTSTTFYRVRVVCGTGVDTSAPVQVTVPALFPGGTYTINSAVATGGTNFQTFSAAVAAISCGISGPVVFNVASGSGPYTEQITIPAIATTSSVNTVTFNGNGALMIFNGTTTLPGVFNLNGADWIRVKRLNIYNPNVTTGFGMVLTNDADNNIIDSCNISVDSNGTGFTVTALAITGSLTSATTSGSNCDNNTITNNTINGGYYCFTLYGNLTAGQYSTGTVIQNNVIKNFYFYGLYAGYMTNTLIEGNDISRPTRTTNSTFYGMYLFTSSGGVNVRRNRIHDPSQVAPTAALGSYAIYTASMSGTPTAPNEVSNNLVYNMRHDGFQYGIYNSSSAYTRFYHNTFSLDDALATTAGVTRGYYQSGTALGIEWKNNIFSLNRGGTGVKHALYFGTAVTATNPYSARNNVYYVPNASATGGIAYYSAVTYPTLAAYQAVSLQDTGSVEANPVFAAPTGSTIASYTPTNASINNLGVPVGVLTDILNAPRNATTPDAGAIEFTPGPCTAPPTAGSATASSAVICAGTSVSFDVSGNSFGLGQTYQWQTSPTIAGTYSPVGTSSTMTGYSQPVNATAYFRAAVTCGTSTTFSTPVLVTVIQPLAGGTYTINATAPASTTNFQSFTTATQAMQCGVTGPVVMNVVANSGPYTDQLYLPNTLSGTSATNTITFNGNNNVINFTATNSNRRGAIMIEGVDWVRVNDLIVNVNTTASTYGFGVHLVNDADNNIVSGCTVNIDSSATLSAFAGMVINGSYTGATTTGIGDCDSNRFLNNAVNGGYYGMTCVGDALANPIYNNVFRGNTVRNFYFYGIYGYYTNGWVIDSNYVSRPTRPTISTFYGIGLSTSATGTIISRNRVFSSGSTVTTAYTAYPLYASGADATTAQPNVWVNNLVYNINGNASIYGMYNSTSDNNIYRHNTIALDDTTYTGASLTYGAYQTGLATGMDYRNNIISIRRTGTGNRTAMYFATATTTFTSNFNDLYVNGGPGTNNIGFLTSAYTSLTAWQQGTGKDSVSVDIDPQFAGGATGTNLTPTNAALDNLGQPIGVSVDAFGNPRSPAAPDMGAIEWSSIPPCGVPTFLIAANVGSNSATLFWTAPSTPPTGYQYVVSTTNTTPTGAGISVVAPPVTVTGLNPGVTYYFFVRTECSATNFSTWAVDSFTTCIPPVVTLTAVGSTALCQGDSATLKANGGAGLTYQFFRDGVSLGTAAGDSILYTTQAGSYTVIVTSANGCFDTSAAVSVTVNPLPVPVVSQSGTNTLTTTATFAAYQWLDGGTPITGATSQLYTATQSGTYSVRVTDANGCVGVSNPFNFTFTNSVGGAVGTGAAIRVFPNPTTGVLFIESKTAVSASVWTLDGRKLMDVPMAQSIDLSGLASGIYMLRLTNVQGEVLLTERVTMTN